jgi:hypothetical protein
MLSRERLRIENARLYPSAIVDQLRTALSNGAELHSDESRKNFYNLYPDDRTYFIYISPVQSSRNMALETTIPRSRWPRKIFPISTNVFAPLSEFQSVNDNRESCFPKRAPERRSASFVVQEASVLLCKRKKSQAPFAIGSLSRTRTECCSSVRYSFTSGERRGPEAAL